MVEKSLQCFLNRKFFLLILLVLLSEIIFSQDMLNDSTIIWSKDYKLKVTDFEKDTIINIENNTSLVGLCDYSLRFEYIDSLYVYNVCSVFNKKGSYFSDNTNIVNVLEHEQLHFDIGEIFARKIRKWLFYCYRDDEIIDNDILAKNMNRYFEPESLYQNQYDKEIGHYSNQTKQQEWIEKVKKELERLEPYSYENYLRAIDDL